MGSLTGMSGGGFLLSYRLDDADEPRDAVYYAQVGTLAELA